MKSKVDTLPGTKKLENFKTGYLTKNQEPNREIHVWSSSPHQEVIGYTGKLLIFYRKFLSGFCQKFTFDLLLVNINIPKLIALGAKPINFYAVVVAVF